MNVAKNGEAGRTRRRLHLGLAIIVMLAPGCAPVKVWWNKGMLVGPDHRRPCAPVAAEFIDFNNPQVINLAHEVEDAAWWNTFADPQFGELIQRSYLGNPGLRAAGWKIIEAYARRDFAEGNLFPQQQQAFGQYQRTQFSENGNILGLPSLPVRNFSLWQFGLNASWELDLWGRLRRTIESANAAVDSSMEAYDDALVSLIGETANTYIQYRTFQRRIELARQNVKTQETTLELAEARFESGTTIKLDVTQARSSLELTRSSIPQLEQGLRSSANGLCFLLGIPPQDLADQLGAAPIPVAPSEILAGVPADLIRRRPDVRMAERDVAAQSAQIGIAMADLLPRFSIVGTLNWQANQFGNLFDSASQAGSIVPGVNWNILNYGRLMNNVRIQDARLEQLIAVYQQTVLKANTEVEDAIVQFLKAQEQAESLEKAIEATRESLQIVEEQYRDGETDFDRVNNLQRELVLQQDRLAQVTADIAIGLVSVYRSLGGGWQIRCSLGNRLERGGRTCHNDYCPKEGPCACQPDLHTLLQQ